MNCFSINTFPSFVLGSWNTRCEAQSTSYSILFDTCTLQSPLNLCSLIGSFCISSCVRGCVVKTYPFLVILRFPAIISLAEVVFSLAAWHASAIDWYSPMNCLFLYRYVLIGFFILVGSLELFPYSRLVYVFCKRWLLAFLLC